MRRTCWALPLLVTWLVACPLVAIGVFDCHAAAAADALDCCQPLEGSGRTPATPLPVAAVGSAPAADAVVAVAAPVPPVSWTARPPDRDALQAVLSVYRI